MTHYRTTPFSRKFETQTHDTYEEAKARAQSVANRSGDWCAIDTIEETADGWSRPIARPEFVTAVGK